MLKMFLHPADRKTSDVVPDPGFSALNRPATLGLPHLREFGADLAVVSRRRQVFLLGRPFAAATVYALAAMAGQWVLALAAMLLVYLSAIGALHDLIHRNLDLTPRVNDFWLFAVGVLALESGHSLQATHVEHHRRANCTGDPEAYVERMSPWRLVVAAPLYRHNLACWAWQHRPKVRPWIAGEAIASLSLIAAAALVGWQVPVLGIYVVLAVLGSWLFPFVSITWLHGERGAAGLLGTKTIRGSVLPRLTLGLTYHLEHHLYPAVPTHNLCELSRRIEPQLLAAGAEPDHLW